MENQISPLVILLEVSQQLINMLKLKGGVLIPLLLVVNKDV